MNPEEILSLITKLMQERREHNCCDPCDPISAQYKHSLARFNDSSAQTSAATQQAFAQAMSVHSAHLLKLQADITRTSYPTT